MVNLNQLAGIQGETRDTGGFPLNAPKFMGNGAKLESPHFGTCSLHIPAEVRLSKGEGLAAAFPGDLRVWRRADDHGAGVEARDGKLVTTKAPS